MRITTNITRTDMLKLNIWVTLRSKGLWIFLLTLWLFISAIYFLFGSGLTDSIDVILINLFSNAIIMIVLFLALFALGLIFSLLNANQTSGVLGEHKFSITEKGLLEKTNVNETLTMWFGIASIQKSNEFIIIRITNILFHIIPKRSFPSQDQYDEFWRFLNDKWDSHN